jgi:hypothetical protein
MSIAKRFTRMATWTLPGWWLLQAVALAAGLRAPDETLQRAVEEDWSRQEHRWGRVQESTEAVRAAVGRASRTWELRMDALPADTRNAGVAALGELQRSVGNVEALGERERRALYRRARWFTRDILLQDARIVGQPLLFLKRNRYICQMLHEYMGYFYDYGDVAPGGGVFVLEHPGTSMETREVLKDRMPAGNFTTLSLSHDGRDVYFAHAERSARKPDFRSAERQSFHIFRVAPDGSGLRRLTDGVEDDFDPCPLPDGGVAFMSTRRGGFARCNNAWEPCASYTLHRMDADGGNIRTLSPHETSEWHPSVLNDGRLVYIRWDYVDRSAANFHGLWTSNPDGTGVAALFGNYTMRINACYQPRAIPGSEKIVFLAGAHHADVGGSLVLLDPKRTRLEPETGEDSFDAVEVLTPEVCFPESTGWPTNYFHSPWPLSEDAFLVSFSHEKLPGMSSDEGRDTRTGLYYFDRLGNLELLYRDPAISSMYPIPLTARPRPPVLPSTRDERLGDEGEFLLADVRRSQFPLPAGRPIRELRVFQVLPKDGSHTANDPRIGHANAESARMLLGSVPVEDDGSAYFRAPAGKPLYFQAVDADGRAVQSMRSVTYLQPGERRGCLGCHEPTGTTPVLNPTLAMRRGPSRLAPGPEGSRPFSFPLLVQPVLDRHCVRCHDGQTGPDRSGLRLTGEAEGPFSRSYVNLRPHLRWYEWGGASISQIATRPGHIGADESPLSRILEDANHGTRAALPDADRRRLYLWLDANAPFYGAYSAEAQRDQRAGLPVNPPRFQ